VVPSLLVVAKDFVTLHAHGGFCNANNFPLFVNFELCCYDPKGAYMGLNLYYMSPRRGIYGDKCTCNV
jgi:hypothetical protein